ncbi:hypothetical protein BJV82DRAFT_350170 [Fennellomyces sp. T-0311]|nr:hypothetical protein BJV82DRAFT_350170 [Fennellomyces sp. T-0311]
MSDSSSERTVKAANITPNATEDVIRTLFEFLGPVTHLQLKDSPYNDGSLEATIEFQDHQAAMTALHLSGTELGDRILVISFHSRVTTLNENGPSETAKDSVVHVYQLSPNVITNDLPVLFGACGPITNLTLQEDPEHAPDLYATIEFATKQGADAAIHFNGRILKDKSIKVCRFNAGHEKSSVKEDGTTTDKPLQKRSWELHQSDSDKGHTSVRKRSKSREPSSYSARRTSDRDHHSSRYRHNRPDVSHDRYHYPPLSSRDRYYYESSSRRRSRERRYHHRSPSSSRRRSYYR